MKAGPTNKEQREAREQSIIQGADYFTVVRYLGPGKSYERHECNSLETAILVGAKLALKVQRNYLIYAVKGVHDTYVRGVEVSEAKGLIDAAKLKQRKRRVRL